MDAVVRKKVVTTANSRLDRLHREGRVFLSAPDADIVEDVSEIVSLIENCVINDKSTFRSIAARRENAMKCLRRPVSNRDHLGTLVRVSWHGTHQSAFHAVRQLKDL